MTALHAPEHPHAGTSDRFRHFSSRMSSVMGSHVAFIVAVLVVAAWGLSGPFFGFSSTWQLVINTGTTIVTFLMVFLIQNTQNRDSLAIQLKLDELLRGTKGPRTRLVNLEELDDSELKELHEEFRTIAEHGGPAAASAKRVADELGKRRQSG